MKRNRALKKYLLIVLFLLLLFFVVAISVFMFTRNSSSDINEDSEQNIESETQGDGSQNITDNNCLGNSLSVEDIDIISLNIKTPSTTIEDVFSDNIKDNYRFEEIQNGVYGVAYMPAQAEYYLGYELCDEGTGESLSDMNINEDEIKLYDLSTVPEYGNSTTTKFEYKNSGETKNRLYKGGNFGLYIYHSENGVDWKIDSKHTFSVE